MGDMLNSAVSALSSYQRALATTSHNIANVNTEGYSRQRVDFSTRIPQNFSFGSVGSGVQVDAIRRTYDQFVVDQVRSSTASFNQLDTFNALASQVGNLLADTSTGVGATLSRFFNSLQDVLDDPASLSARQVLVSEGESLADLMSHLDSQLQVLDDNVDTRITSSVSEINGLADRIAQLNQAIVDALGQTGGAPPNDLLDQRDRALVELNQYVKVSVVDTRDGAVNVFIGSGDALVLANKANTLSSTVNEFDPTRREVTITTSAGQAVISDRISGGSLGGALQFRSEILDPARNELGRIAIALGQTFNDQHAMGMDLTGALGGDFFAVSSPQSLASRNNTGTAAVTTSISDLSALTTADYRLYYNGTNYQLFNQSTGAAVTMSGSGTVGDPFVADGLSIVVSGSASAGDEFLIRPTLGGAGGMGMALSDPAAIAVAAPTRTRADAANSGSASISAGEVIDISDPQLLATASIDFVDASNYQINGAGPLIPYTSGDPIDINGTRVVISGVPATGDRFVIESNAGGIGDNRNGLLLAGVENLKSLAGGSSSISDASSNLVGSIAVATRSSEINRQSQETLLQQNIARRESISGVNLDEEAADMLRFQQAYQAAAQAVTVANNLFQVMLSAFQR